MKHFKNIKFTLLAIFASLFLTASMQAQPGVPDGFDPNANGGVFAITVQADGKILIGGDFTELNPNGSGAVARNLIARLNTDGTLNTAFDPNPNNIVLAIAVQADGKILIGGFFISLNPNGSGTVTRNRIARLNAAFGTTAASVSISGRVSDGRRGLPRAIVHITDQNGDVRTVRTNMFGYFRFSDIEAGQILVVNVFSRQYQFTTQVISLNDSISNLNFIAQGKSGFDEEEEKFKVVL